MNILHNTSVFAQILLTALIISKMVIRFRAVLFKEGAERVEDVNAAKEAIAILVRYGAVLALLYFGGFYVVKG